MTVTPANQKHFPNSVTGSPPNPTLIHKLRGGGSKRHRWGHRSDRSGDADRAGRRPAGFAASTPDRVGCRARRIHGRWMDGRVAGLRTCAARGRFGREGAVRVIAKRNCGGRARVSTREPWQPGETADEQAARREAYERLSAAARRVGVSLERLSDLLRQVTHNEAQTRRFLADEVYGVPDALLDDLVRVRLADLPGEDDAPA